jgi:uncharacterized membrane protein
VAKIPKSLLLILLLGLGLRLVNLGQSFWLDEASQAVMSSRSLTFIWSGRAADFNPPLFYILAHYWLIFGHSEIWLRLPSVLFGVADIFLVYLLARDLRIKPKFVLGPFTFRPEILAALFLAINPFHIYYSQEFRAYMLLCFLGTWAMWFLYREKFKSLIIINILLIYTHYSAIFLIITELIYISVYKRQHLMNFLTGCFWVLLFYLPWLPMLTKQLIMGLNIDKYFPGWRILFSLSPLKTLPETLFQLVAGRINLVSVPLYLLYIAFVIVVVFLAFRAVRQRRNFLFSWVFTPVIIMILVSFFFPQNQPFRVIYIIPALVIIFIQACIRYPKLFTTFFVYIAIFGNIMYFTRPRLQREQWRQTVEFLRQSAGSESAVLVKYNEKFAPLNWYDPQLGVFPVITGFPATAPEVSVNLNFLTSPRFSRIYLLEYLSDLSDPNRQVEMVLSDLGYKLEKTYEFSGVGFIRFYIRT